MQQGINNPAFYAIVLYKMKTIKGFRNFSDLFTKLIGKIISDGYNPRILRCAALLAIGSFTVKNLPFTT